MKQCSKCKLNKDLTLFHNDASRRDGKYPQCKQCRNLTESSKKSNLKRNYGLTVEQKQDMIEGQQGKCPICQSKIDMASCVDHCHTTGNIRDILCQPCNKMLGFARDNTEILKSAIKYLDNHR